MHSSTCSKEPGKNITPAAAEPVPPASLSEISLCGQVHFINHFSGCQLCTQQNKNEDYKACETEFIKSFEYANSVMMKMLARRPPRNATLHAQIAALPFCQVRTLPSSLLVRACHARSACQLRSAQLTNFCCSCLSSNATAFGPGAVQERVQALAFSLLTLP